jgi:hypothetical protein
LDKKVKGMSAPSQHFHAAIFNALIPSGFYDRGFAVCRNPYTRMISEYRHQLVRGRFGRTGFDVWVRRTLRKYRRDPFVNHNHLRPQVEFLDSSVEVFRFEEGLQRVVDEMFRYCDVTGAAELPRMKHYEKKQVEVSHSTLRVIESFYWQDFKVLAYDPADLSFTIGDKITVKGH